MCDLVHTESYLGVLIMVVQESMRNRFPDVYEYVYEVGYVTDYLKIYIDYMLRRTDDDSSVEYEFGTPEQAQAYIDSLEDFKRDLEELVDRFKSISHIED